jgi:Reverse transcriptase (RNA-dependent DNA polymerase)
MNKSMQNNPHTLSSRIIKYVLLNQALYGLPQSGFKWAARLHATLKAIGFYSIADDDNLYSNNFNKRTATVFITVCVDDLVIASKYQSAIDVIIHNLNKTFNVHNLHSIL